MAGGISLVTEGVAFPMPAAWLSVQPIADAMSHAVKQLKMQAGTLEA